MSFKREGIITYILYWASGCGLMVVTREYIYNNHNIGRKKE